MEKILIYSTANNRAGAQKVIADLAYSYRLIGNQVDIALPIFPYHRVFLSKKDYLNLIKTWLIYFLDFLKNPSFKMSEIIEGYGINIKRFFLFPSKRLLDRYDKIIVTSCYLIKDILDKDLIVKSSLYIFHPLELNHKNPEYLRTFYYKYFENNNKLISLSQFTKDWFKENMNLESEVLIPALSRFYWPAPSNSSEKEYDILINYIPTENKGQDIADNFLDYFYTKTDKKIGILLYSNAGKKLKAKLLEKYPSCEIYQNVPEREMPGLYSKYKLFLYPSRFEGFGIPPLEAISNITIPIIFEGVGGSKYFSSKNNTIYLNENNLLKSFEFCLEILNDNRKLTTYQNSCRNMNFSEFSPNEYADRYNLSIANLKIQKAKRLNNE